MTRCILKSLVVVVVLGLLGCKKSGQEGSGGIAPNRAVLADLAEMLKEISKSGKKPPSGPADLAAWEGPYPSVTAGLSGQQIVYRWGAALTPGANGNTVIAHEKKVPSEGGLVLMQDGTIKEMTAEEFKSAPKAGR
jgi:hypothetical protein